MRGKLIADIYGQREELKIGDEVEVTGNFRDINGHYIYYCKTDKGNDVKVEADVMMFMSEVNWDHCRIEFAKAALQGILSNEDEVEHACVKYGDKGSAADSIACFAMECADALVKSLKDKENNPQ